MTYDMKTFEDEQEKHRMEASVILRKNLEEIRRILCETYESFVFQKSDVQKIWFKYVA